MEPNLREEPPINCWEFPPFRLDRANALLWRNDQIVPMRPKNFAALCYLVERHGKLVTKDELLDKVWGGSCVCESVLKTCINELRRALDDDFHAPTYLVTVARRGYRFIASVTEIDPSKKTKKSVEEFSRSVHRPTQLVKRSGCWISRRAAQAQLQAAWQSSLESSRQIVFLTGEAGIGKTTLIEMFLNDVHTSDPMVFRMRCVEHFGNGEAMLPMIEAMEKRCRAPEGDKLIGLLHHHAPVWLAQLPSVLRPEEREALQREIFGAGRERMIREGCELLETLSRDTPLILVLEDLHWSDSATLDFLSLLARRSEAAPLMILASYRPIDVGPHGQSAALIHRELRLRGMCSEIVINPFDSDEVKDYLIQRFPGMAIPTSVSQALFKRTGGNPLFLSNLVEYLVSKHEWPLYQNIVVDKALPDTIIHVIEREIERLKPDEQHMLEVASAIGEHFSGQLLASVLNMEIAEVDQCCSALVKRGQILLVGGLEQACEGHVVSHYAFRHALYIEVLYQRIAPAALIRLHSLIAESLERLHEKLDPKYAAELALHFEKGWNWIQAISYLKEAAANATRRFANHQAYDYLIRALGMVERLPPRQQVETRMTLLKQSSGIRRLMGDMVGAKSDLEGMLFMAKSTGNIQAEVSALIELSRVFAWLDRRSCLDFAQQAVTRSKVLDDQIFQSMVKGMWGGLNLLFGQWREDCATACYKAMELARVTKNPLVLHSRLTQHICVELLASHYRSACVTAEEALVLSRNLGDGYMFTMGNYYYGLALLHLGNWGKLQQLVDESKQALDGNDNASLPLCFHRQIMMAWLHVEAGDFAGAKIYYEEALSESAGPWSTFVSVHCSAIFGRALLGLGDYINAVRCFEAFFEAEKKEILPICRNYLFPAYRGASETWLSLGEFGKARHYAQQLQDLSIGAPEQTYLALSYCLFAEIAIKESDLNEANLQMDKAIRIVESAEVPLATWTIYKVAQKLCFLRNEARKAKEYEFKKQNAVQRLLRSLQSSDPLCEHLLNSAEISTSLLRIAR